MKTNYLFALLLLLLSIGQSHAQDSVGLKLSDLKAQGAVQLSKDELQVLLPGAKVKSMSGGGSTRFWENSPDGKFVASTDSRASMKKSSTAQGTWSIGDNATFCVHLEWKGSTEQWCRFIFKTSDRYFGVKSVADGASPTYEFSFSR